MLVSFKGLLWKIARGSPARHGYLQLGGGCVMLEITALPCQDSVEWLAYFFIGFNSPRHRGMGRLPVGNGGRALLANSAEDVETDQQQDERAPRVPHRPHAGQVQP